MAKIWVSSKFESTPPKEFKGNIFVQLKDWYFSFDKFARYTFTSLFVILFLGIATMGVIFEFRSHASTTIATQSIDSFDQDSASVSGWTLTLWPSGATGNLSIGQGSTYTSNANDKAANINFTFQSSASGDQQVGMQYLFPTAQPQAGELGFLAKTPAGVKIIVYVFDNSGQRFEYDTERPLEAINPNNWYQEVIKLDEPTHYINGANNGVIQWPIKQIAITAEALESQYNSSNNAYVGNGTVSIDNIEWVDVNTTTVTRDVNPQDSSIILPPTATGNFLNNLGIEPQGSGITTFMSTSLQQAKAKWARRDITWANVETSPGVYNWSYYDSIVSALKNIGVKTLFILDYGNPLYMYYQTSSGQYYGDTSSNMISTASLSPITAYVNFAKAAATHYNQLYPGQVAFEVWNEPSGQNSWYPNPDASAYATLEQQTVAAIHSVNTSIPITTMGFDMNYNYLHTYISAIQSLGGEKANALSFHPYRQDIPETISDDVLYMRSYLQQSGLSLQPWISEWGYPTDSSWWNFSGTQSNTYIGSHANNVTLLQAKMVSRQLWTALALGIQHMEYYKLQDLGDIYGLWDASGNPKPSWTAFTTATNYMQQFPNFVGIEPMQLTNLHTLVLQNGSQYLMVLWKDGGISSANAVLANIASTFPIQSAKDYMGNSIPPSGNSVWVNDTPVYVVVNNPNAPTPTPTPTQIPTPTTSPIPTATPILPSPTPKVTDTITPTVSITSPSNGTKVSRKSVVTISATASDDTAITQVQFLVNNQGVCTITVAPYICTWTVPGKSGASYTLTAKALDSGNLSKVSNPVSVTAQ